MVVGGAPLQNLIQRGHRDTMLTALRMVREMDAGQQKMLGFPDQKLDRLPLLDII